MQMIGAKVAQSSSAINAEAHALSSPLSDGSFDQALTRFHIIGMPHLPPIDYFHILSRMSEPARISFDMLGQIRSGLTCKGQL